MLAPRASIAIPLLAEISEDAQRLTHAASNASRPDSHRQRRPHPIALTLARGRRPTVALPCHRQRLTRALAHRPPAGAVTRHLTCLVRYSPRTCSRDTTSHVMYHIACHVRIACNVLHRLVGSRGCHIYANHARSGRLGHLNPLKQAWTCALEPTKDDPLLEAMYNPLPSGKISPD